MSTSFKYPCPSTTHTGYCVDCDETPITKTDYYSLLVGAGYMTPNPESQPSGREGDVSEKICHICGKKGHIKWQCPENTNRGVGGGITKEQVQQADTVAQKYGSRFKINGGCFNCGSLEHWSRDCDKPLKDKIPPAEGRTMRYPRNFTPNRNWRITPPSSPEKEQPASGEVTPVHLAKEGLEVENSFAVAAGYLSPLPAMDQALFSPVALGSVEYTPVSEQDRARYVGYKTHEVNFGHLMSFENLQFATPSLPF